MERTLIDFQPVRLTGNGHISNEGGYFSVPAEGKAYGFDIAEMDLGDYFDIVPVNREEE